MGQTLSNGGSTSSSSSGSMDHIIPETVSVIQDEVIRQARVLTEIAVLSYEDFQQSLTQLNELCKKMTDINGKQLLFAVKKGTDSTVLWKGTVKIACIKLDPETKVIESHRLFNLNQFLKIFKTLECQLIAAQQSSQKEKLKTTSNSVNDAKDSEHFSCKSSTSSSVSSSDSSYNENSSDNSSSVSTATPEKETPMSEIDLSRKRPNDIKLKDTKMKKFTASMLLEEVDNLANRIPDKLEECSICLERKPDVMLSCAHTYCNQCIEQWNSCHKTCPFCRETLDNIDDTWVISDIPGSQEIRDDICSALMDLTSPE
ncbi:hypothetical protein RUM43_006320 [Polyplax serrata]|uniref:RING finger protein 141 n=1 Tax=Polyplax serrata TaxID=468196 RepID=A0AAN8PYK6_POLSC